LARLVLKRVFAAACAVMLLTTVADAQQGGENPPPEAAAPPAEISMPTPRASLSDADAQGLRQTLAAARLGDRSQYDAAFSTIGDPVARKIAAWAMVDASGDRLSFFELDQARRDLADWPRGQKRQTLAEKTLETSSLDANGVVQWFGGTPPRSAEGAMALAAAYQALGRNQDAQTLIRDVWRGQDFDVEAQRRMLARFSAQLRPEDHIARAQMLLYGSHGPGVRDMLALLPADERDLAEARIALRANARDAASAVARLSAAQQKDGGVVFERAGYLLRRDQTDAALALTADLPPAPGFTDGDERVWTARRLLINAALRKQDYRAAYAAASHHGFTDPVDLTDAEFYAGWLALSKLHDAAGADVNFARIQAAGASPITQGRALYWRGRAHEAMNDPDGAQAFYRQGAKYAWTFYGQLAAEKAGIPIVLGVDPQITPLDRSRFDGRETVQAARILAEIGEKDLFRVFVLSIDDNLPTPGEYELLVDMARSYGDLDLGMRVVRTAAQKGYLLPDRGYPLRTPPQVASSAETALIFGITRQESGFDPKVRSGADARGMMQLLPSTAQTVARRLGVSYSAAQLYEPDYNMRLGASYIGQMIDRFGGSYVLAAAGYNAGPGRPPDWVTFCGDPRTGDPLDFIECIPFSETRNYVMRVMEGMQVYRARLNGGQVAATLSQDLKRGSPAAATVTEAAAN
jgi:soluble lytic murein transglycosylase